MGDLPASNLSSQPQALKKTVFLFTALRETNYNYPPDKKVIQWIVAKPADNAFFNGNNFNF